MDIFHCNAKVVRIWQYLQSSGGYYQNTFHVVLHIGPSRRIHIQKQKNIDQSLPEVIFKMIMKCENSPFSINPCLCSWGGDNVLFSKHSRHFISSG